MTNMWWGVHNLNTGTWHLVRAIDPIGQTLCGNKEPSARPTDLVEINWRKPNYEPFKYDQCEKCLEIRDGDNSVREV